ncbi:MAG: stage II sporulation protein M [Chloroflexi bacterium]|nr:stage II sporulation protein M [Chloroflexota bacterium]
MVAEDFINAKHRAWERLTQLTSRAQSNIIAMDATELQELGRLYRQATSDLAQARRDFPGHPLTIYLNDLVAKGHSSIYRERNSPITGIKNYFLYQLPQAFRELLPFTGIAFLAFFLPAIVAWVISYQDPVRGVALAPEFQPVIDDMRTNTEWWRDLNDNNAEGAVMILSNNIFVSFQAFVGGLTLGLLTLYALYYNGLMLGILSGAAQNLGFADNLWGFIAAHGPVELSIIFLAGGAGLQLAWAILRPGMVSRRAALAIAAQRSFKVSGAIVMFLILAGLIEGFISPQYLPLWFKIAVGIISAGSMYAYLLLAGRNVQQPESAEASALKLETPAH